LGGAKKRTLAQAEKTQSTAAAKTERKKEDKVPQGTRRHLPFLTLRMNENEAREALGSMKAITVYGVSRVTGVNASVASSLLDSLVAKHIVRKVGGYSGHWVYAFVDTGKPSAG